MSYGRASRLGSVVCWALALVFPLLLLVYHDLRQSLVQTLTPPSVEDSLRRGTDGNSCQVLGPILDGMTASVTDALPAMLTIQQAAAWLGVDQKTVRRYIAQGRLKGVRIADKLIRVERESLLAL